MPKRIKIPYYAKIAASKGLKERKLNKAGLTKNEASKLGITSGVERAKQLLRNKYIKENDAKDIARFYARFRNCKTNRCETAINLWGGRRLGILLNKIYFNKIYK